MNLAVIQQPVFVSSSSRPRLSSNQRLLGVLLRVRGTSISSNSDQKGGNY
ncbi:hypothetical protein ES332_D13G123700v1 [Gossypium tomentosum]|uniref:Uncharacterized protein n=1 Tax=Gossypium tomentosum TaxID=34277 RepID=A0A5D2HWI3_GOSTO|nr:hypothetical protein ES332_D13G123700v1 [Gossypium tomentosum]